MWWGVVLLLQDPFSVDQSQVFPAQLRIHSVQLGRIELGVDGLSAWHQLKVDYAFKISLNTQHCLPGESILFGHRLHHLIRIKPLILFAGTWNKPTSHHRLQFGRWTAHREDAIDDKYWHATELEWMSIHAALLDSISWPCRVDEDAEQPMSMEYQVQQTISTYSLSD
jgi:hypothetical protein